MKCCSIPFCKEIPDDWQEIPNKYLFEYDVNKKSLHCNILGIIPILLQRILILFDLQQLQNKEIYMPYRCYKPFSNIPIEAVKQLKRIFGENAIKEI